MASRVRVKLNIAGFNAIRNSEGVSNLLMDIAEEVAAQATANTRFTTSQEEPFAANLVHNSSRAVAFVSTTSFDGILAEAHDRALSKALAGTGLDINPGKELVDYVRKRDGKKIRVTRAQAENYSKKRTS